MRNSYLIVTALVMSMMLVACKSESTSTTTVNFSTTNDEGTKEYSYTSENNNGEVTEESSYTETPITDEAEAADDEIDDALWNYGVALDDSLESGWDSEGGDGHRVTCDPDRLYVHTWQAGLSSIDNLDEDNFVNDVIPKWQGYYDDWRQEMDEAGLEDVGLSYFFDYDDQDTTIFSIEDGQLTYSVFN